MKARQQRMTTIEGGVQYFKRRRNRSSIESEVTSENDNIAT